MSGLQLFTQAIIRRTWSQWEIICLRTASVYKDWHVSSSLKGDNCYSVHIKGVAGRFRHA